MRNKENSYKEKYYTNQTIRGRIDRRLHDIAALNANLGTDSTEQERQDIENQIDIINKEIENIDPEFYDSIRKSY